MFVSVPDIKLSACSSSMSSEIQPFVLHALPASEAQLCPVHALAEWLVECNITQGYLFHKIASGDHVAEANCPMVCVYFPSMSQG